MLSLPSSDVRSCTRTRPDRRRIVRLALLTTAVALAGCEMTDHALAWSVRRGQVGEFVIRDDEVVTIGARLTVYEATTGRRRRRAALPADLGDVTRGQLGPGALVTGDSLVFGWYDFATETGTVFCFDAGSLRPRWQWQVHWPWRQRTLRPSLAVAAAGEHVYAAAIGKEADNVFAFRLADGRLAWSRSVEAFPTESALAVAGDRLIVRSQLWARTRDWHEQLDALALVDGRRLWRTWLIGEAKYHTAGPLIDGGYLYTTTRAGPDRGHLYVVRLSDGHTIREEIETAGAPFAKRGDTIYLGGAPPLAWDVGTRRVVWRGGDGANGGGQRPMIAGGAIDDGHDRVFTGDSQRFVYVRAARTGLVQRGIRIDTYPRFEIFSPLKALHASYGVRRLQVHRGMLFVGTVDGSLFVFQVDQGPSSRTTGLTGRWRALCFRRSRAVQELLPRVERRRRGRRRDHQGRLPPARAPPSSRPGRECPDCAAIPGDSRGLRRPVRPGTAPSVRRDLSRADGTTTGQRGRRSRASAAAPWRRRPRHQPRRAGAQARRGGRRRRDPPGGPTTEAAAATGPASQTAPASAELNAPRAQRRAASPK